MVSVAAATTGCCCCCYRFVLVTYYVRHSPQSRYTINLTLLLYSESLKACQSLLSEYLPKLKALPGAQVTRQVCGGCLDFKVSITQPLEEHGAWAEANYDPIESEFMEKLKGIEGTSLHEVQEITFETL